MGDGEVSFGLPEGFRFIGPEPGAAPRWPLPEPPADDDIASCVACGLCLPHCPTYRLTGEESASPRGRIAAMRAVSEGRAEVDGRFMEYMDLCLACRACEDVCPSHVPFGRMMERARAQVEPLRPARQRLARWLGLEVALPRGWLVTLVTALLPLARPLLPRRTRALLPRVPLRDLTHRLPRVTEPWGSGGLRSEAPTQAPEGEAKPSGSPPVNRAPGRPRGTVALLAGCVQDRWYRPANRATIRVLARNGWRVLVPPGQTCCGALAAHNGRLRSARALARRNLAAAFAGADWIVVGSAGCGAHMKEYGELLGSAPADELSAKVRDLMEFLDEQGIQPPAAAPPARVALHDPCHLLHAQRVAEAPRAVLRQVPGLEVREIEHGDRCCGAAGLYNVLEPGMADRLKAQKAAAIHATGAAAVLVANPGCAMQIATGLAELGSPIRVLHPAELLDRAYAEPSPRTAAQGS